MDEQPYGTAKTLLTSDELAHLIDVGATIRRGEGYIFISEGEETDHVLLIRKGHVKVMAGTPQRMVAIRSAGEIVGEMAAVRRKPRSASIVALDDVEVLLLRADQWLHFLFENPRAMLAQLYAADERLEQATKKIVESDLAVEQRLAKVLVELAEILGAPGNEAVVLRFSQQDLATLSGASLDSVKKIIRIFKSMDIVRTGRQVTTIIDLPALHDVASGNVPDTF